MPSILITGANRGIGLQFAKDYSNAGWDVIATARNTNDAAELNALDNVDVKQLDVADDASVDNFMQEIGDRALDVFINNAGVYGGRELDRDSWIETLKINTVAPTLLAERLKPNIAKGGQKKMAVLTSQMGSIADNESGGSIIYRSSKAGLNAAWKSLSIDYKDDGVAVVMLHPGWVQTDMGGENAKIDTQTSVNGMMQVIDNLSLGNSGEFRVYDGSEMAW